MSSDNKAYLNNDLTVLVNTCDAYSDVLSLFFAAFREYWPNCKFEIVVNTEYKTPNNYTARIHNYKKSSYNSWGDRLLQTLQSIKSEFVMVLYDDFILENFIDEKFIEKITKLMKEDDSIAVFYLVNTGLPTANSPSTFYSEITDYSDYKLNSFPAIWRKSDLESYTGRNDNPWAWEVFGSYRTFGDGRKFYSLNSNTNDVYQYNYSKGGAIYRGKWVKTVVLEKFDKYNLDIDTSLRGFAEDAVNEKRDIKWKINFMAVGFKMVGIKSLIFIPRYFKAKFNARK